MDRSGPGNNFAAVRHAAWNEIFLSGLHLNLFSIDNQRIAALHNEHIFVVNVDMWRRCRSFTAGPIRHLASISAVEDITLNTWGRLTVSHDPVGGIFHEFGKIVHGAQ